MTGKEGADAGAALPWARAATEDKKSELHNASGGESSGETQQDCRKRDATEAGLDELPLVQRSVEDSTGGTAGTEVRPEGSFLATS